MCLLRRATVPHPVSNQVNCTFSVRSDGMATRAVNGHSNSSGRAGNEKEKIPLTREGYDEKRARLHFLITERRQQVADYIHEAKDAGDVSESSAYEDAKNIQAM